MIYLHDYKLLFSDAFNVFRQEGFNGTGIYCAYGLIPSSKFLQPIYIGSALNLKRRLLDGHITELKHNKHKHNNLLQRYYNDNGSENLIWILLEECGKEELLSREQFWLDSIRPFADENRGFNISKNALSPWLGQKLSQKHKDNISKGLKGKSKPKGFGEKVSKMLKGRIPTEKQLLHLDTIRKLIPTPTEETKKKMSESHKGEKNHFFGKRHTEKTIQIIKEKNTGKIGFWRGKKLYPDSVSRMAEKHEKEYWFIDPFNEKVLIKNLKQFCKKNELSYTAMHAVYHKRNRMKSHKGWRRNE